MKIYFWAFILFSFASSYSLAETIRLHATKCKAIHQLDFSEDAKIELQETEMSSDISCERESKEAFCHRADTEETPIRFVALDLGDYLVLYDRSAPMFDRNYYIDLNKKAYYSSHVFFNFPEKIGFAVHSFHCSGSVEITP